ncbi:MAG: type II toxin-antitoxin system HipA family toxin [Flavobacteriales bacterium]
MATNPVIKVYCFGSEIGVLGWDEHRAVSLFQYHPDYLASNQFMNLIPGTGVISRVKEVQVFKKYNGDTFRGLPPIFADSLPDVFGNIIFKSWLESNNRNFESISVIEQLAYVSDRGMGALEYRPKKEIPPSASIHLGEIVEVLKEVLEIKGRTVSERLNHESLLNIFKIGTSAGGARPKILLSESKSDGSIVPGDINYSGDYEHYLVKLNVDDDLDYSREMIEYAYYLASTRCGIVMMDSKLIENRHFATKRFDRIAGEKRHILTASGLTGWDFKDPANSSYENLFDLALFLRIPHSEIEELFRRMVFNVVFANNDDHLKNHSFVYDRLSDSWGLSPAYDITYSLNPLMNFKRTSRALSINNKRTDIGLEDIRQIARKYTIRSYASVIEEVQSNIAYWRISASELGIPSRIIDSISRDFVFLQ